MTGQSISEKGFTIRNVIKTDLDNLMRIEQTWPEDQRASADKLLARLEKFPDGFWVGEVDHKIVGMTTSCLVRYDPGDLSAFRSWNHAANNGYIFAAEEIADPNALYVVSTVIEKGFRGKGLFGEFFEKHKEVTAKHNLAYCLTGAMLPGYDSYCRECGDVPAFEYATRRIDGRLIDPLIRKLTEFGFTLPNRDHVIPHYFQSAESRDYAALLVYTNPAFRRCS